VDAGKLLVGGERRFVALQVRADAGSDQLIVDRTKASGLLRMMSAHVMPEAVGMRYESGRHDDSS
jgi:hypothetical protein